MNNLIVKLMQMMMSGDAIQMRTPFQPGEQRSNGGAPEGVTLNENEARFLNECYEKAWENWLRA